MAHSPACLTSALSSRCELLRAQGRALASLLSVCVAPVASLHSWNEIPLPRLPACQVPAGFVPTSLEYLPPNAGNPKTVILSDYLFSVSQEEKGWSLSIEFERLTPMARARKRPTWRV